MSKERFKTWRKRPVYVQAEQLTWSNWPTVADFADVGSLDEGKPQGCYVLPDGSTSDEYLDGTVLGLQIPTLEGLMLAVEGDWIIRGVHNELYPCKPDIFEETYEQA